MKEYSPPNRSLHPAWYAVAILYLFQHRPKWRKDAAIGKTLVSAQTIVNDALAAGTQAAKPSAKTTVKEAI